MMRYRLILAALALTLAGCGTESGTSQPTGPAASATAKTSVVVKHKLIRITKRIPFTSEVVDTSSLKSGAVQIEQAGHPGTRIRVVRETIRNGVVVKHTLVRTFVARAPVQQVKLRGTYVA